MKIKKKYFHLDLFFFNSVILLIFIKLLFSYLSVENGWWLRHIPPNVEIFNPLGLPANFSGTLDYLIVPLLFIILLINFKFQGKLKGAFFLSIFLLFLNAITSIINQVTLIDSLKVSLKLISPIWFFISIISLQKKYGLDLKKLIKQYSYFCLFLAVFALLFFNESINRVKIQWPIYFGGIHTHSYVLSIVFIGISYKLYKTKKLIYLLGFFISTFLILFIGYGVRTVLILYLLFITAILYLKNDFFKYLWLKIVVFLPVLLVFGIIIASSIDMNKYSSGRLDMYQTKYEVIKDYSIPELLFGRGSGSDLMTTDSWWYAEKGSHSDFITYPIENGFIYLVGFIVLIILLIPSYTRLNLIYLSLILGYYFSSLISNGIAGRPLAAYLFFLVLAYIYCDIIGINKKFNA